MKTVIPRSLTEKERLDPALAGGMSAFLPGTGQIYDGDPKRGLFFLAAGIFNYLVLLLLLFARPLLQFVEALGNEYHMVLNPELAKVIYHMQFGSAASIVLFFLFVGFAAYAARDAYDRAVELHRKPLYADHIVGLPEASSGSYIFHASLLVAFFILAFFFLVPPPPTEQYTVIEFQATEESSTNHQKTTVKSDKDSRASGKENPKFAGNQSSSQPKSSRSNSAKQATAASQTTPAPNQAVPPKSASSAAPAEVPLPRPIPQQSLMVAPAAVLPMPTAAASIQSTPRILPTPSPSNLAQARTPSPSAPRPLISTPAAPTPVPIGIAIPAASGSSHAPMPPQIAMAPATAAASIGTPGPSEVKTTSSGGDPISPVAIGGKNSGTDAGSRPSPTKGRGTSGSMTNGAASGPNGNMMAPVVGSRGSSASSAGPSDGPWNSGKPGTNTGAPQKGDGPGSRNVEGAPDWGPYMADLQRRIKRQWYPPKDLESRTVKVMFKVHRDGQMSNLRLLKSSGIGIADQAAMKAVEAAAPFRSLPAGAGDDVDIEFTFDYNVFGGGGSAKFRSF